MIQRRSREILAIIFITMAVIVRFSTSFLIRSPRQLVSIDIVIASREIRLVPFSNNARISLVINAERELGGSL